MNPHIHYKFLLLIVYHIFWILKKKKSLGFVGDAGRELFKYIQTITINNKILYKQLLHRVQNKISKSLNWIPFY